MCRLVCGRSLHGNIAAGIHVDLERIGRNDNFRVEQQFPVARHQGELPGSVDLEPPAARVVLLVAIPDDEEAVSLDCQVEWSRRPFVIPHRQIKTLADQLDAGSVSVNEMAMGLRPAAPSARVTWRLLMVGGEALMSAH